VLFNPWAYDPALMPLVSMNSDSLSDFEEIPRLVLAPDTTVAGGVEQGSPFRFETHEDIPGEPKSDGVESLRETGGPSATPSNAIPCPRDSSLTTKSSGNPSKGSKLPLNSILVLQDWLIKHHLNPYPDGAEKIRLASLTNLTLRQISDWFTRTRSRKLEAPSVGLSDNEPIDFDNPARVNPENIPGSTVGPSPMERFLGSPPKDEPAPIEAIRETAESASWREHEEKVATSSSASSKSGSQKWMYPEELNQGCDSFTMSGASSGKSRGSHPSHASWVGRRGRRKHARKSNSSRRGKQKFKYQCTWGCRSFRRASEWRRHEESQHAPQTQWTCLHKALLTTPCCLFCDEKFPSKLHYETQHNVSRCLDKSLPERTFDRKDHLRQHTKQVHYASRLATDSDLWKRPIENAVPEEGWKCGFCHSQFFDWNRRVVHVKAHFDSGLSMHSWDLSSISVNLSRLSRRSLQKPDVLGCSRCCRGFKRKRDLTSHQQLPHLSRTKWTCSDAFSALISSTPEVPRLQDEPGYIGTPSITLTQCFHCGWTHAPSLTFVEWKTWLVEHLAVNHLFNVCQQAFEDPDMFQSHLSQGHGIFINTSIYAGITGYIPFEIATSSFK
jgi:hypothetical protein